MTDRTAMITGALLGCLTVSLMVYAEGVSNDKHIVVSVPPVVVTSTPANASYYLHRLDGSTVTCPEPYVMYVRHEKKGSQDVWLSAVYLVSPTAPADFPKLMFSRAEDPLTVACLFVKP